ncbi:MAG: cytochrome c biogenesis protein CcsA, partial [Proteobacteria bacterium]|nr:cytochrome c biogenesis protein CcsA [Pseudomonadota bacterium]
GINLNFSNALLIIGLITVLIYTVLNLRGNYYRLEFLTLIPVLAIILFNPIIQNDHYITQYFSLNALVHVLTALVGYSFLAFGAIFSIFLRFIENDLHEKNDGSFFSSNLSILAMENQLFTIYWIGFILLSITMLSGSYFSEELFGAAFVLNHKFLLSLLAWLLYGGLLIGRAQFGWRGKKAINLSLSAFLILVLAYIGTKFILEIVLA